MENPNESQRDNHPGMGNLNRYNSSQYGVAAKKEEPMEIESPSVPYYLPSNKSGPGSNMANRMGGNQGRPYQQQGNNNGYGMMSNSQNISSNCSNISMNSNMNLSQASHRQPQYQPNYNQPQANYNQPQGNFNQPQGNYNHPQGNYNQPHPQAQSNNYYNNYNQGPKTNNYFNQNNAYQPNPNQPYNTPNYRQPQQEYTLPDNWEDMAATVASSGDPDFTEHLIAQMNEKLFT